MLDDGVPDMQFKLLCTSPNQTPEDGILVWCQDCHGKCMLPNGEPKPCTLDPMRNRLESLKVSPDSLKSGKNCMRTLLDMFGTPMNH